MSEYLPMRMCQYLPRMGLLVVQNQQVPFFVRTRSLCRVDRILTFVGDSARVIITNRCGSSKDGKLMLMLLWDHGSNRHFVHCWISVAALRVGAETVRRIQRAWRSHRERRRMALCMAAHSRLGGLCDPALVRMLRSLCVEEMCLLV